MGVFHNDYTSCENFEGMKDQWQLMNFLTLKHQATQLSLFEQKNQIIYLLLNDKT